MNQFNASMGRGEKGSVLVIAIIIVAALMATAGLVLEKATRKYHVLHQAQAWQESIQAAESGVDLAVAALKQTISDTNSTNAWSGWVAPTDATVTTNPGLTVVTSGYIANTNTVINPIPGGVRVFPLLEVTQSGTSGNSRLRSTVLVDSPDTLVSTNFSGHKYQFYRVRSYGTADVPGPGRAPDVRADGYLRRYSLIWDRWTGQSVSRPQVTRMVEAIVQPVAAFDVAILGNQHVRMNNHNVTVDSYDSTVAGYDPAHRNENGHVATNGDLLQAGDAHIYGDVMTYSGTSTDTANVTGEIRDDFYKELESVPKPGWLSGTYSLTPTEVVGGATLGTGSSASPARYVLSDIKLTGSDPLLTFDTPPTGTQAYVEIWVKGDVDFAGNGQLTIPVGVNVKIYVEGNANMTGNGILNLNGSSSPHSLQLYGIKPADGSDRTIKIAGNGQFVGTVYAPDHDIEIKGGGQHDDLDDGSVYGAVVGKTVFMNGVTEFHYDESLATAGDVLGYRIVSWYEDWRNIQFERDLAASN